MKTGSDFFQFPVIDFFRQIHVQEPVMGSEPRDILSESNESGESIETFRVIRVFRGSVLFRVLRVFRGYRDFETRTTKHTNHTKRKIIALQIRLDPPDPPNPVQNNLTIMEPSGQSEVSPFCDFTLRDIH